MSSSRGAVPATLERRDTGWTSIGVQSNSRSIQGQFKVNSRSIQGQFRVNSGSLPGGYKGGTPGPLLEIDTDLKRGHDRPGDCVPASRSARPRWQPTTRLRWLQGPATTEIDSPHLRGRRRLNRRLFLILSKSPSADISAWEFAGNLCGNRVGMWELDRVSLRSRTEPSSLRT